MKIINMQISTLKPYAKNAKKHPQKQIDLLAKNIERFGFTTPVLIDKDFVLIAGHGRVEAMKQLGRKEVPAVVIDYLTDDEVKALRKADNKLAEMGEWDMEIVIDDIGGLDSELLALTGFSEEFFIANKEPENLTQENNNNNFVIKCTFKSSQDLEDAHIDIQEIVKNYTDAYTSVSGGEL
jgi:ParB-like nuclease domain